MVGMSKTRIETFKPPSADDPVLPEVVRRLVEVYHPLRIYLFGSAARGDAGPDSDYDIMVVVPDDAPRGQQDCEIGYRALWGVGLAKDILVWTKTEFEKRLHLRASLPSTIMREETSVCRAMKFWQATPERGWSRPPRTCVAWRFCWR
jgi:hypothetical protein